MAFSPKFDGIGKCQYTFCQIQCNKKLFEIYKKNAVVSFPSLQDRNNQQLKALFIVPDQSLSDARDVPQVDFANK
jgi:hypothetical protein